MLREAQLDLANAQLRADLVNDLPRAEGTLIVAECSQLGESVIQTGPGVATRNELLANEAFKKGAERLLHLRSLVF